MTSITITLNKINNIIVDQHIDNYHNFDDIVINLYIQDDQKLVSDTCLSTYQCTSLSIQASISSKMTEFHHFFV